MSEIFTSPLTPNAFKTALTYSATFGGAVMIATPDKERWLSEVKDHATPCTTVYVRNPFVDSPSPVTCMLFDDAIDMESKKLHRWVARCERLIDKDCLKGFPSTTIPDSHIQFHIAEEELPY